MITNNITVTITTPSDREAVVTREFNAPAALVFAAITRADLIKRWYGSPGSIDSVESDPRVGGSWRFAFTAGGKQMAWTRVVGTWIGSLYALALQLVLYTHSSHLLLLWRVRAMVLLRQAPPKASPPGDTGTAFVEQLPEDKVV